MLELLFDMLVISSWFSRILDELNTFLQILLLIFIHFNVFDKVKIYATIMLELYMFSLFSSKLALVIT
jgi:hypothetical protein